MLQRWNIRSDWKNIERTKKTVECAMKHIELKVGFRNSEKLFEQITWDRALFAAVVLMSQGFCLGLGVSVESFIVSSSSFPCFPNLSELCSKFSAKFHFYDAIFFRGDGTILMVRALEGIGDTYLIGQFSRRNHFSFPNYINAVIGMVNWYGRNVWPHPWAVEINFVA